MSDQPTQVPRLSPERIAAAVDHLADAVADADQRAQLHALAGMVRNLVAPPVSAGLAAAYRVLEHASEDELPAALGRLAALEADRVDPPDWDAMSRG